MLISDIKSEILPLRAAAEQFRAIFRLAARLPAGFCAGNPPVLDDHRLLPAPASALCLGSFRCGLSDVAHPHLSSGSVFAAADSTKSRNQAACFCVDPEDVIEQQGDPRFTRAATAGSLSRRRGGGCDTTNSPFHGRELLYEIHRQTDAPVKYVIDTNSRGDYTLGMKFSWTRKPSSLDDRRAGHYAPLRQELARRLEEDWRLPLRMRGFHTTLPNQTFEGELGLRLGSQESGC